jgi:hypothetical protein
MDEKYQNWIIDNCYAISSMVRGRCQEICESMQFVFPELILTKGLIWGTDVDGYRKSYPHWWLKTSEGEIIDPTVSQFDFIRMKTYDEAKGEVTGKCMNCGGMCYDNKSFCSDICASLYCATGLLNVQRSVLIKE